MMRKNKIIIKVTELEKARRMISDRDEQIASLTAQRDEAMRLLKLSSGRLGDDTRAYRALVKAVG